MQVENVTDDGKVIIKTLKESEDWKKPNEGAKVCVCVWKGGDALCM